VAGRLVKENWPLGLALGNPGQGSMEAS